MTLSEIKKSDKAFLTPQDISEVLGSNPQSIRTAAKQKPELLGFPVTVMGVKTMIPRVPFINFVEGKS